MKRHHFIVLVVAAVLLVVAALWSSRAGNGEKHMADEGLLLPSLREQIDAVSDIRVVARNGNDVVQIALQKKGEAWLVADKNYRADTKKLADIVNALADAKRIEAKTAKSGQHAKLGVVDPSKATEGAGKLVRLLKADGTPVADVVLGNVSSGRKGQYARIASEAQVWLISASTDVPTTAAQWLDHAIADISGSDITDVDFGSVKLQRDGDDKPLSIVDMPKDRELTYEGVTTAAASALSSLQLQDVATPALVEGQKTAATAVFTTKTHIAVTVTAYRLADKNYLALKAAAQSTADDAARKQVDAWNAQWTPWVYEVDNFTYNKFVKSLNDFTQPLRKAS